MNIAGTTFPTGLRLQIYFHLETDKSQKIIKSLLGAIIAITLLSRSVSLLNLLIKKETIRINFSMKKP